MRPPTVEKVTGVDELRTERLLLARMQSDDFDELCRMHRDPRVMATLGGVRSDEQSREFLAEQLAHWERHGFGWWTLRTPQTGRLIGRGGLRRVSVEGKEEVEVAYALVPEFWGQGLATELAAVSAHVAFEFMGRKDLVCFTLPTNRASRRVMEKVGFRYERDIVHAELPHVLYRLTAVGWRETGRVVRLDPSRS